jgi:hypothetical protein
MSISPFGLMRIRFNQEIVIPKINNYTKDINFTHIELNVIPKKRKTLE